MEPRERLIVALDIDSPEEAKKMVEILSPEIDIFKVGIAPFTGYGREIIDFITKKGKKIFLDLKIHDIPNTVANTVRQIVNKNIFMINFHCLGGRTMLEYAKKEAENESKKKKIEKPLLIGVTVLTSMDEKDVAEIGVGKKVKEEVLLLSSMAKKAGMDGVVASSFEAEMIKKELGKDFKVITPGIRPSWAEKGDQKRILTPEEAIKKGADFIVVGRPIIGADNPLDAAVRILKDIQKI